MLVKDQVLANDRIKIDSVGLTINRKEMEYAKYIIEHRYNVKYMWIKYQEHLENCLDLTDEEIDSIDSRVQYHDMSKFSLDEFNGYRMAFYPIEEEYAALELANKENVNKIMQSAWEHHYRVNDHHPEHYVDERDYAEEMPKVAVVEMILDWCAMSFQQSSKIYIWWERVKNDKFILHPNTRALIEKTIHAIKQFDIQIGEY